MAVPDLYPVSMHLNVRVNVVNATFKPEKFQLFCDHVVEQAFTRDGTILAAAEDGLHACCLFENKSAWHFYALEKDVTLQRLNDVAILADEVRALKAKLHPLGYGTRKAKVVVDARLFFVPNTLPRRQRRGYLGAFTTLTLESSLLLQALEEAGFLLEPVPL